MITKAMLNALDGEVGDLSNLLDALDMIAWEWEQQPCEGGERQTLNALQGTVTAARKQITEVRAGISVLFDTLRQVKEADQ